MKHCSIVPLIGGITFGMESAIGKPPEYLLSYRPFEANDRHLVEHYRETRRIPMPLIHIDEGGRHPMYVDVVSALCPCAGLSALSPSASSDNKANDWMLNTAKYVLGEMKPKAFWGENAPGLAGSVGRGVLAKLQATAKENGYSMTLMMTSSHLHGIGQTRIRSFYFFFPGDKVPVFEKIRKPHRDIDKLLLEVSPDIDDEMDVPISQKKPSRDDPFYRFLLEEVEGGITHRQYYDKIEYTAGAMDRIEKAGVTYDKVAVWMRDRQMSKIADRCERIHEKLMAGGNVMRKVTEVPKVRINAFVGHMPTSLTHPHEDRYITIREALAIMGMPDDFVLRGGRRSANHICQNVPVKTAAGVAEQVLRAVRGELDFTRAPEHVLVQNNRKDEIHVTDVREPQVDANELFS